MARTDASGRASVQLLSAEPIPADGLVTITAETAGEDDALLTAQTQVLFSGPTEIRLTQPVSFAVDPGEAKTFVFYVGDSSGNPLAPGTEINVSAKGGTVTGQTSVVMPDIQSTDATRFAVLFAAFDEGQIPEMTIAVLSPNGDRRITFVSGSKGVEERVADLEPASIVLETADSLLIGDGTSTTQVTATVRDQDGNGVPNVAVFFRSSTGSIDATGQTDGAGRATAVYRSSVNPAGVPRVDIEANVDQLNALTGLRLLGVRLALTATENVLAADGISQTTIRALLTTEDGRPVPFVAVNFGATLGTLSALEAQTDVNGQAVVTYTGVESPTDLNNVKIRTTASGLDTDIDLQLRGVILQVTTNADTIVADGNAQALIQVDLRRTDGVPVPNGVLSFRTNLGTLSSAAVETDSKGSGQVILVSGTDAGKATVAVRYGLGLVVETEVAFVKGPPASIVLRQVDPPSISVKGSGADATAIVTFQVLDERGNPVADGEEVVFSLDPPFNAEETVGPERTATVDGLVHAAVNSGTVARTVRLIAEAVVGEGQVVRSTPVPIAIHGGLPDQAHFSIAPKPVNLAGRVLFGLESTITAYVFDKYSNPVPAGTSVRYSTDGGGIQGSVETNANGQGNVLLFTAEPVPLGPDYLAQIVGQTVDENGNEIEALSTVLFSGPTAPIVLTGAGGRYG